MLLENENADVRIEQELATLPNQPNSLSLVMIVEKQLAEQASIYDESSETQIFRTLRYKPNQEADGPLIESDYHRIRVNKINHMQKPSLAIYIQNMTRIVKKLRLEGQIVKNKSAYLKSYTSTMSHEFETPLGTSIMFLEMLIRDEKLEPQVL